MELLHPYYVAVYGPTFKVLNMAVNSLVSYLHSELR